MTATTTTLQIEPGRLDAGLLERAASGGARWVLATSARAGIEAKIGRASCRERV